MMARGRGWYWPWLVTAALAFTVGVNVVMIFAATSDANGSVVEPDYYRKAVAWDQTMARAAESAKLGWRTRVALELPARDSMRDSTRLVVDVTGPDSQPVRGARFNAELIHNIDASHPLRVVLTETRAGRYEAMMPARRAGMWEVRLEARRDADRFVTSQRAEAAAPTVGAVQPPVGGSAQPPAGAP
jgi:nitrogen fixation protein FixH